MSGRVVVMEDGDEVHVGESGRRDGPTIILCDGIGCDGYIWRYIKTAFEPAFRLLHLHYRGHGLSPVPADPTTLCVEQFARDIWQVADAFEADRVILWGHSMGVQVILEAAHLQPHRVGALIPMCGAYERPLDTVRNGAGGVLLPVISSLLFARPDALRRLWRRVVPSEFSYKLAATAEINAKMIRREDFFPYLEHLARMDPVVFVQVLNNLAVHSARSYLGELAMPALVFAGSRDNMTPPFLAEDLCRQLPDAALCVIPGGSHAAPVELPDLVTLRAERFLRHRGIMP